MIGLIGKKIGMTQIYMEDGKLCPSTVIEAGPCPVIQVKSSDGRDGYNAVKLGFQESDKVNKPEAGIAKTAGVNPVKLMKEFRVDETSGYEVGSVLTADVFAPGDTVKVTGTTRGRGFSGVMRRHKFSGGLATHGCRSNRIPGSIGCSSDPSRVTKGRRMPGQYGAVTDTVKGLEVLRVDPEKNIIFVKGAVPGASKGIVVLTKQ